jgi:hypothetical protein
MTKAMTTAVATAVTLGLGLAVGCGPPRYDGPPLPAGTHRVADGDAAGLGQYWLRYELGVPTPRGLTARLFLSPEGITTAWLDAEVRVGEVLPAFGTLHRFVDVRPEAITFKVERPLDGQTFADPRSLVLAPGGQLTFWPVSSHERPIVLTLSDVTTSQQGPVAWLRRYEGPAPLYAVKPEEFQPAMAVLGQSLSVHGRQLRVLAVRHADPARGLPPWIEIASDSLP